MPVSVFPARLGQITEFQGTWNNAIPARTLAPRHRVPALVRKARCRQIQTDRPQSNINRPDNLPIVPTALLLHSDPAQQSRDAPAHKVPRNTAHLQSVHRHRAPTIALRQNVRQAHLNVHLQNRPAGLVG